MANHSKNMLVRHHFAVARSALLHQLPRAPKVHNIRWCLQQVGCGGKEAIDQSHFVGAVYGMENIMGRCECHCNFMKFLALGAIPESVRHIR